MPATRTTTDSALLHEIAWRANPGEFSRRASGGKWVPYRHQRYIMDRIAAGIVRGGGRIDINAPSRHGKSQASSLWIPIWLLDNLPHKRVILCSYEAGVAAEWGRQVRNEFDSNPHLITRLREDSTSAERWNTPEGGGMVTAGVGGPIASRGGDLLIIDDPIKNWQDAYSRLMRQRTIDWFNSTFYPRAEPGATIVVLQHRWHEEDLSGYLIERHSDTWDHIRLPALAEKNDPLGRAEGEALCPERYSREQLLKMQLAVGKLVWASLFQQNPESVGAGRVYDRFFPATHVDKSIELRDSLPIQVSFDFNVNPGMHVVVGQNDTLADLITACHEIHGPRMKLRPSLDELESLLRTQLNRWRGDKWVGGKVEIFGDATGDSERAEVTETAYDQIRRKFGEMGIPIAMKVPRANPPVRERVDTFNEAMSDSVGDVHYKINPQVVRLIEDLKTLKESEEGTIDKSDTKLSHSSDAEGYRVHWIRPIHRPKNNDGRIIVTA